MNPNRQVRRTGVRPNYARRGQVRQRRRLRMPVIRLAWLKVAVVVMLSFGVFIGIANLTRLHRVEIRGNHTLATEHLARLAQSGTAAQWFGTNTVLINSGALEGYIENAEPGVGEAKVHRGFFHTLTIDISERQPTLNWKNTSGVYLLDANATVIGPTKGTYVHLPTVIDSSNLPVIVGKRVAPTSFVSFSSQLSKILPSVGYAITEITVPATTSEVYVKTSTGLVLKFDTTRPAPEEISDLQAVQAQLTKTKKAPTQYIDVRIAHKAYYL